MINLQDEFIEFHENIKLEEGEKLRSKRDILLKKLKNNISEDAPSYVPFNQGSYAMGTGITPDKGDYDIDVGLRFSLKKDEYEPLVVKKWVKDALEGHTKSVVIRRSCVTVTYQEEGEDAYHIDFAIYSDDNPSNKMYIAKGKENSLEEKKFWELSDPMGLINAIKDKCSDSEDLAQFRRIIRYLKKWKNINFPETGSAAPTGIALTVLTYNRFEAEKTYDYLKEKTVYDDFTALKKIVSSIIDSFSDTYCLDDGEYYHTISERLIVEPRNDLFEKMTNKQMDSFYNKMLAMENVLEEVTLLPKKNEACEKLRTLFGDDFPIKYDRSVVGTSESA